MWLIKPSPFFWPFTSKYVFLRIGLPVSDFSHLILEVTFIDYFDSLTSAFDFIVKEQNALFVDMMHRPHFHLPGHFLYAVSCWFYFLTAHTIKLPVENEVLSMACTRLVEGDDLQIVITNTEQTFCSRANKPSSKFSSCLKAGMFRFFINSPVFFRTEVVLCPDEIVFVWFNFEGVMKTIHMCNADYPYVNVICHLSCDPSIPWPFFKEKAQTHIAFHELLCQTSTQTNRWQAWCELPLDQTHQTWSSQAYLP